MALGLLGILGLGGVGAGIAGGLGYGFGIRYGFERIFPAFQQGGTQRAIKTAASDIASLLGGGATGQEETDTFLGNLPRDPQTPFNPETGGALGEVIDNTPPPSDRRDAPAPSLDTSASNKKYVTFLQTVFKSGYPQAPPFRGEISIDEIRNLISVYEKQRNKVGVRSTAGKRIQSSINSMYRAIASF